MPARREFSHAGCDWRRSDLSAGVASVLAALAATGALTYCGGEALIFLPVALLVATA